MHGPVERMRSGDAALLHRNRSQAREPDHIARRENVRLGSPVVLVHLDPPARIRRDPSLSQIQLIDISLPPHCVQQRVAG